MQTVARNVSLCAPRVSSCRPKSRSPEKPTNSSNRRMRAGRADMNCGGRRGREVRETVTINSSPRQPISVCVNTTVANPINDRLSLSATAASEDPNAITKHTAQLQELP